MFSKMKCALNGCANRAPNNAEKYFFSSPKPGERRELWIKSTGKTYGPKSNFRICEDHFDVSLVPKSFLYAMSIARTKHKIRKLFSLNFSDEKRC